MLLTKDKSFYKSLFLLALPIALQNLITFAVGFADNVMIASLGDSANAGVYMGNQIQMLLQIFTAGLEGAILVLGAQYWGREDTQSLRKVAAIGVRFALLFGVLLTIICFFAPRFVVSLFTDKPDIIEEGAVYLRVVCLSYGFFCITQSLIAAMRSVEKAKIGLYVSAASLVLNIGLNYILIFGKLGFSPMGVAGAALATLISRIAECIIIVIYVFFVDKRLGLKFGDFLTFDKALLRDFVKYGAPIVAGQLVWAVNTLSASAIMGRLDGEGIVSGLSIANTLYNLAYVASNGMSGAVGIITGKTVGRGEEKKMREYAVTVQILFLGLGLLTGLGVFLLKNPFVALYPKVSAEAAAVAKTLINVSAVTLIGTCYQAACLFGLVKSGGDVGFVFKNDFIFVFLVVLPSALIASRLGADPWIVYACLKSDQILKCIVAVVKINRFNWMKNLTRGTEKEKSAGV